MKMGILIATALAATLPAGAAFADCAATCNANNAACSRSGKDYGTCMGAWHACKSACLTPVKATSTPAPKPTPAVARH